MVYRLQYGASSANFRNKDDLILRMMEWLNGDGVVYMKLIYPDGSYWELFGDD